MLITDKYNIMLSLNNTIICDRVIGKYFLLDLELNYVYFIKFYYF